MTLYLGTRCACLFHDPDRQWLASPCEAHLRQMLPGGREAPIFDEAERARIVRPSTERQP